jgi:hypothetical protein
MRDRAPTDPGVHHVLGVHVAFSVLHVPEPSALLQTVARFWRTISARRCAAFAYACRRATDRQCPSIGS